ncbi:MAG: hypothetical protein WA210_23725, partial [Burkholderiaceae bacterium]
PKRGARVGPAIRLDFQTHADLHNMAVRANMQLNIGIDGTSLIPEAQDLKRIGRNRYRYVFALHASPGPHVLSVYWSDTRHGTIESTVRRVKVTVVAGKGEV